MGKYSKLTPKSLITQSEILGVVLTYDDSRLSSNLKSVVSKLRKSLAMGTMPKGSLIKMDVIDTHVVSSGIRWHVEVARITLFAGLDAEAEASDVWSKSLPVVNVPIRILRANAMPMGKGEEP